MNWHSSLLGGDHGYEQDVITTLGAGLAWSASSALCWRAPELVLDGEGNPYAECAPRGRRSRGCIVALQRCIAAFLTTT
jgi:hypothetical protein